MFRAKSVFVAVVALCLSSATNSQAIYSYTFDDGSCGAWVKSDGNIPVRLQYYSWFRGFVSGHNYANPKNQVALQHLSDETLQLYINKFCQENPLEPFTFAALHLVKEFPAKRAVKK